LNVESTKVHCVKLQRLKHKSQMSSHE
jgi:hypothetical protein